MDHPKVTYKYLDECFVEGPRDWYQCVWSHLGFSVLCLSQDSQDGVFEMHLSNLITFDCISTDVSGQGTEVQVERSGSRVQVTDKDNGVTLTLGTPTFIGMPEGVLCRALVNRLVQRHVERKRREQDCRGRNNFEN